MTTNKQERINACIWGGAVGDAWGAPLERATRSQITERFGSPGLDHLLPNPIITDDTQKLLFTIEAMLMGDRTDSLYSLGDMHVNFRDAYLRWLQTQDESYDTSRKGPGFLLRNKVLWSTKRGGRTTYTSLRHMRDTGAWWPESSTAKGCGGVMAIAPVGFIYQPKSAFKMGCMAAQLTHSERDAFVPSGAMAMLVSFLASGKRLRESAKAVLSYLESEPILAITNTTVLMRKAIEASVLYRQRSVKSRIDFIEAELGEGWNGDEAFAISLFCALCASNFEQCIITAVNHTGDSDSTGAISGNIWGAAYGDADIIKEYGRKLNARKVIDRTCVLFCDLSNKVKN